MVATSHVFGVGSLCRIILYPGQFSRAYLQSVMSDDLTLSFFMSRLRSKGNIIIYIMPRCCNCQRDLSRSADSCPSCGDSDPFCRKWFKKKEEEYPILSLLEFLKKEREFSLRVPIVASLLFLLGLYQVRYYFEMEWYNVALSLLFCFLFPVVYFVGLINSILEYPRWLEKQKEEQARFAKQIESICGEDWYEL